MPQRKYIDFKLYLTGAPGSACQVALLPTPQVGETIFPVVVPADKAPNPELLEDLKSKDAMTMPSLVELGKRLAGCLLPEGPIREMFCNAFRDAREDEGVRLRLIIADNALRKYPWEYVYLDPLGEQKNSMRGFLALDKLISIVRHEALPKPHPVLTPAPAGLTKLPMLIAAALPEGEAELDLDQEVANIKGVVKNFNLAGMRITPKVLRDPTREELGLALAATDSACIFHFAGHGTVTSARDELNLFSGKRETGSILLVTDHVNKQSDPYSGEELARHLMGAGVRLVVLGACHSGARSVTYPWDGVAGALAANGIPAIIAMQYEVLDEQAIAFSRAFYAALALGLSLDEATWSGRVAMLENTANEQVVNVEWGVPVLYSRLPDGALFPERIQQSGAGPSAEAFRKVIDETVRGILEGSMTGVEVELIENGVKVIQKVNEVKGELIGIKAGTAGADANIEVVQDIGNVTGTVRGLVIKKL